MIRTTATVDTSPIDALIYQIENHDKIVAEIGSEVMRQYEGDALAHLQAEPGTPKYPLRWASDKQRKFVMALLRKNNNLPYRRTHELSQGWEIVARTEGGIFSIVIHNPAPEAKYVYGSLVKDLNAARRFQQPFHQDTGWQQASITANYWLNVLKDEFIKRYRARLGDLGKAAGRTRAYTR